MKKISVNKTFIFDLVRSTIIAVIISLLCVLVFALIVNLADVGEKVITPINTIIKIVSVFVGCIVGFKDKSKGAIKGALSGLLYTLLAILIFGIISHSVKISALNLLDIGIGIIAGTISGLIAVNIGRKKRTEA